MGQVWVKEQERNKGPIRKQERKNALSGTFNFQDPMHLQWLHPSSQITVSRRGCWARTFPKVTWASLHICPPPPRDVQGMDPLYRELKVGAAQMYMLIKSGLPFALFLLLIQ